MNLIENGNFESGTTDPWTNMGGGPATGVIETHDGRNWMRIPGEENFADHAIRYDFLAQQPWNDLFAFSITTKAVPTGGVPAQFPVTQDELPRFNKDGDVFRLTARIAFWFDVFYGNGDGWRTPFNIEVSVHETFMRRVFKVPLTDTPTSGRIVMANWGGGQWDIADIWITNLNLQTLD